MRRPERGRASPLSGPTASGPLPKQPPHNRPGPGGSDLLIRGFPAILPAVPRQSVPRVRIALGALWPELVAGRRAVLVGVEIVVIRGQTYGLQWVAKPAW